MCRYVDIIMLNHCLFCPFLAWKVSIEWSKKGLEMFEFNIPNLTFLDVLTLFCLADFNPKDLKQKRLKMISNKSLILVIHHRNFSNYARLCS